MTIQKWFIEMLPFQWVTYVAQWGKSNWLLTRQIFKSHVVYSSIQHLSTSKFLLQNRRQADLGLQPYQKLRTWTLEKTELSSKATSTWTVLAMTISACQFLLPRCEAHYSAALLILLIMSGNSDWKPGAKKQESHKNDWKYTFWSSQT